MPKPHHDPDRETHPGERERLWGSAETAEFLNIPLATLHQWAYLGTGPRSYRVGKYRRYRPSDVEAWLEERASRPAGGIAATGR